MAAAAHNMSPHTHAQAVGEYRERVGGTDVSPRPRPMTNPFAAHVVGGGPDFAEWSGGAQPSDATPFMSSTQVLMVGYTTSTIVDPPPLLQPFSTNTATPPCGWYSHTTFTKRPP